jgi:hypothetical protein
MKSTLCLIFVLFGVMIVTVGCGCGGSQPKDEVKAEDSRQASELSDLALKVKGDFNALKPEEKAKFIAAYGSKAMAKKVMKVMAHPPHQDHVKKDK